MNQFFSIILIYKWQYFSYVSKVEKWQLFNKWNHPSQLCFPLLKTSIQTLMIMKTTGPSPCVSKILKNVVFFLVSYFNTFNVFAQFRKECNEIPLSVDSGSCDILVLLDLSASSYTVDHIILLKDLEAKVGLQCPVLKRFTSCLRERTFSGRIGSCTSSLLPLNLASPKVQCQGQFYSHNTHFPLVFSHFGHYLSLSKDVMLVHIILSREL